MVESVDDPSDPRLQPYSHVGDHDWLKAAGLFVAEGRLVVRRLLASARFPVHSLLLTPAALQSFGGPIDTDAPTYIAAPELLNRVTGFNFHRGCLALAWRPPDDEPTGRFADARRLLALEGVGNPDNVGGLFRVAAAFAVDGVLLDPTSGDPFYRKALRTSMGAVLQLPFERAAAWPAALDDYREWGFAIVALTPSAGARDLETFTLRRGERLLVLVGAEGSGLSEGALSASAERLRIPIAPSVDSLNVVVAAGIALAHLTR